MIKQDAEFDADLTTKLLSIAWAKQIDREAKERMDNQIRQIEREMWADLKEIGIAFGYIDPKDFYKTEEKMKLANRYTWSLWKKKMIDGWEWFMPHTIIENIGYGVARTNDGTLEECSFDINDNTYGHWEVYLEDKTDAEKLEEVDNLTGLKYHEEFLKVLDQRYARKD
jgi:hypothetical protein